MTSLEKAINLGYLFLTFKPKKKTINTCTTFFCMYCYVSIYSEECFWPQYMYSKLSPFNRYRWCPIGKLSHLGPEQLYTYADGINYIRITKAIVYIAYINPLLYFIFWKPVYYKIDDLNFLSDSTERSSFWVVTA